MVRWFTVRKTKKNNVTGIEGYALHCQVTMHDHAYRMLHHVATSSVDAEARDKREGLVKLTKRSPAAASGIWCIVRRRTSAFPPLVPSSI